MASWETSVCVFCNLYKGDRTVGSDEESGAEVSLFNPRSDEWGRHFAVDVSTGTILGQTPVGRATMAALQMNRPVQLAARLQWMLLGIYPSTSRPVMSYPCQDRRAGPAPLSEIIAAAMGPGKCVNRRVLRAILSR